MTKTDKKGLSDQMSQRSEVSSFLDILSCSWCGEDLKSKQPFFLFFDYFKCFLLSVDNFYGNIYILQSLWPSAARLRPVDISGNVIFQPAEFFPQRTQKGCSEMCLSRLYQTFKNTIIFWPEQMKAEVQRSVGPQRSQKIQIFTLFVMKILDTPSQIPNARGRFQRHLCV